MLGELAPAGQQGGLFATRDPENPPVPWRRSMPSTPASAVALRPAATGMFKAWAGRQARHSPRYTDRRPQEMLVAKAF